MEALIQRLHEERLKDWEQAKTLLDKVEEDKRSDFSPEEKETWERINTSMDEKAGRIKELTDLDKDNKDLEEQRKRYPGVADAPRQNDVEEQVRSFFRGEIKAVDIPLAGVGRSINHRSGKWEVRDLVEGSVAAGGATVPLSFRAQLYEFLVENSAIRQTNATILSTASGESINMPKVVSKGTAAIVGEGTALAEADPSFGTVTLLAWKYGQLIQLSSELVQDTAIDMLGFVAKDSGEALAYATGNHYLNGTGTNQPQGVFAAAGTGVTGGTGVVGVPTSDNLMDLFYSVIPKYRRNSFWVMGDATAGVIRKIKLSTNEYMWAPGLQVGEPDRLLGRPVIADPFVPAMGTGVKSIAFGDFSSFFIRDAGAVRFERSDEFAFDRDLVTFRAVMRTDSKLVDLTGAIKLYRGGTA
jgi:HK97 family phage major capsid protein